MIRRLIILLLIVGCGTEPQDCAGVAGGTAELDCFGVCGGVAIKDDCGLCIGGTTGLIANYLKDCAGVCGGNTTQEVCDECPSLVFDCAGVCDGSAVVGGCNNTCGSTLVVDECGVCGGSGKQTTYVEECEEEYVCNNVTTWVQLYGDSYCSSSSCNPYQSCSSNGDCCNYGMGCCAMSTCITAEQQTETVCDYETVCENVAVTSCP